MEMDKLSDDALRVPEMNFPNHAGIAEVRKTRVK
jgi:hypothetical protein